MPRAPALTDSVRPVMTIIVQRQLDNMASGNGAYLETFLRMVRRAGMDIQIVFAPYQSFGNRPWARVHPRLAQHARAIVWPGAIKLGGRYWSVSPRVWTRFAGRLLREVAIRLGAKITITSYLGQKLSLEEARKVAQVCDGAPATITLAEYSSAGPALKQLTRPTLHACLMHDLLSDRTDRARAAGLVVQDFDETTLDTELGWISTCQLVFFASANEMTKLRPLLPSAKLAWVPPDAPDYAPTEDTGAPRVVFIGTVHAGNTEALGHFLADVWPKVRRKSAGLELHIAGSIGKTLTPEQAGLPGVRILGRVDKLESLGGANAIGIAPARFATGVSIKVAEYLLLGMPTVAYPMAIEGFGNVLDGLVQVAEGEDAFAEEIVALANDPDRRKALSVKARAEARAALSHDHAIGLLHSVLPEA